MRTSLITIGAILMLGCERRPIIVGAPEVSPSGNPTVMEVAVETQDSASLYLKLQSLSGGGPFYTKATANARAHRIALPALKPASSYLFQVCANGSALTQADTLHTPEIPKSIVRAIPLKTGMIDLGGYLLTQRRLVRGSIYMLDKDGNIIWNQEINGMPKLSHFTSSGNVLVLYGNKGHKNSAGDQVIGMSFSGDTLYQVDLSLLEEPLVAHHEVKEYEDDLFVLVDDTRPTMLGGDSVRVKSSAIVRMTKSGKRLWKWSIFDVKDPAADTTILEHLDDWGHANAFSFDTDGNILLSCRDWNQIWKVDIKTGKLIWTLGGKGSLALQGVPFSGQHAIHINKEGHYMLFDNGRELRQSRVLSYVIAEGKAEPRIVVELPDVFYADRMGNAQLLPNGHLLVCSPRSSSILVLDKTGTLFYQVRVGLPDPYRITFIPSFYTQTPPK